MTNIADRNHIRTVARAGPVSRAVAGAALAVLACIILTGCSKTTKPKDVKYNIYFAGSWYQGRSGDDYIYSRHFYVYDADSLTLRDSIPISCHAVGLEVSPDGRGLYVWCSSWGLDESNLTKIDVATRQVVWSVPGYQIAAFLDRGQFLMKNTRPGPEVIDPADGHTIRQFTIPVRVMQGPPNGTKVAAIVPDTIPSYFGDTLVTVLDVKSGEMHGNYVPRLISGQALHEIHAARLHPDGKRVLIIGAYGSRYYSWFMVGDVLTGETLFRHRFYSPYGEIAISEDGALAVASDPGNPKLGDIHRAIEFFDLGTMQHLKTLDYESGLPGQAYSQVRFLPGDRRIAIAPTSSMASGPFCVIDRATLTVENIVQPPVPFVGALGVGVRP